MRMCQLCAFERNDDTAERCRQCGAEMEPLEDPNAEIETDTAWFHYLQIPGIGTVELVPGRAFRLGREARNELVIPKGSQDQMATIFWTDDYDEATIKEMGAPEGTKVEGVRITGTRTLKGGEELVVGPLHMTYLRRAKPIKNAIDAGRMKPRAPSPARAVPDPRPVAPAARPARGRAVAANPAGVIVALEQVKASGTLRVSSERGRGWVTVVGGAPRHAAFGGLSGRSALLAILALANGRCQMVPGVPAKGQGARIEGSFSQIIAARRAEVEAVRAKAAKRGAPAPRPAPPGARPPAPPRPSAVPPPRPPARPPGGPARPGPRQPGPPGPRPAGPAGPAPRRGPPPPRRPGT